MESPADTELIQISMEGRDPKELAPVINAVIKAYMEKVVLEDQREELSKLEYLYQKRDALETELKSRMMSCTAWPTNSAPIRSAISRTPSLPVLRRPETN